MSRIEASNSFVQKHVEVLSGEFYRVPPILNWWAARRRKFGVTWGRTWLDRDGTNGTADSVLFRSQWVF